MMGINLERLKAVDKYILYAILRSPCGEVLVKELRFSLMEYYKNKQDRAFPSNHYIRSRCKRLVELGFIYSKGRRPLRLAIVKDNLQLLREYIITYVKGMRDFYED